MVIVNQPTWVQCDQDGCSEAQPALLVLLMTGGFGFKPTQQGWQVGASENGTFITYCPKHIQYIQKLHNGSGVRLVDGPSAPKGKI